MNRPTIIASVSIMAVPVLAAEDFALRASSSLRLSQPAEPVTPPTTEEHAERLDLASLDIGEASRWYFSAVGGLATDFEDDDETTDIYGGLAVHHFLTPSFEVVGVLDLYYFDQEGDEAFGLGPSLDLRWHFLQRGRWTVFGSAGIGLLFSTDDVPTNGTSFNFTPRAGVGATYRVADSNVRLVGGVRWHHISNANITGEDDNPDRDGILGYLGVMIPF
ncbi:MAG: acyloxyacyl hydrolase [Planctomycetota bacterium]